MLFLSQHLGIQQVHAAEGLLPRQQTMFCTARSAMPRLASGVVLPTCGVRMTFGSVRRSRPGPTGWYGSRSKTSSAAPPMTLLGERVVERDLVHDRAARRVDEPRVRLHQREPLAVDEVRVLGHAGNEQADEVGLPQRLAEIVGDEIEVAAAGIGAVDPLRRQPTTRISKPRLAIRATAWPMRPAPTMVSGLASAAPCRAAASTGRRASRRRSRSGGGPRPRRGETSARPRTGRAPMACWCTGGPTRSPWPCRPTRGRRRTARHAPARQRRVERIAVRLTADDDVAGAGLGDGLDERCLFRGRRHESETRRRAEDHLASAIFGFGHENDGMST